MWVEASTCGCKCESPSSRCKRAIVAPHPVRSTQRLNTEGPRATGEQHSLTHARACAFRLDSPDETEAMAFSLSTLPDLIRLTD